MTKSTPQEVSKVLAAVEVLSLQKGLAKREVSNRLGIPFNTFRAWFQKNGAKSPSGTHLAKLRTFVEESSQSQEQWKGLWNKVRDWWRTQHRYSSLDELAEQLGWTTDGLRGCLENESDPPRLVVERLAQLLALDMPSAKVSREEAMRRLERLRALLTLVAEELAWFRDGPAEVREIYRSELNQFDTGYISSLLTMLSAEDKFQRWLEVTTNRFAYFKTKGSPR